MCVVSFVGDHYQNKFDQPFYPWYQQTSTDTGQKTIKLNRPVSSEEFEKLQKEVQELKELLIKAKEYDERNNEPNCEMEDKIKLLREIGKIVGVDLDEVFKQKE